jgi:uncharacterized membrane protein YsdA (DUF1294 family)
MPSIAVQIVLLAYALMSVATFAAYLVDKRAAVRGRRRIPERTLHWLELCCGWPGALAAQQCFRHKRRKGRYIAVVIAIVALHAAAWGAWFVWAR